MTQQEKFINALQEFTKIPSMVIPGNVVKVDQDGKTCDVKPLDGGATLLGVKLKPTKSSASGFWMIPSVDSAVLVGRVNNNDNFTYLAMMSDVEKVIWVTKTASIELAPESIVMNGGKKGGLPISANLAKVFNSHETRLSKLEQAMASHTHVDTITAAPTGPGLPPFIPSTDLQTKVSDLENTAVKQ